MARRYSFEDDNEELYVPSSHPQPPSAPEYFDQQPRHQSPPRSPVSPAAHPDSSFNRLQAARRFSRERNDPKPLQNYGEPVSPIAGAPIPPPHRDAQGRYWGRELGYTNSQMSNITPGEDNFGEQASGGIAGVALSVADANARESGLEAMRNTPGFDKRVPPYQESPYAQRAPRGEPSSAYDDPYVRPSARQEPSHSSLTPLGAAAFPPGIATPHSRSTASPSLNSFNNDPYMDNPYNRRSRNLDGLGPGFDPNLIADDGDDGLEYRNQSRSSMLSLGHHSDRGVAPGAATAGAGSAAAAGGILGTLGGLVGRNVTGNRTSPQYDPVQNQYGGPNDIDIGQHEKSEWLSKQSNGRKKLRWLVGIVVALLIVGGIAGGIVGGVLPNKKSSSNSSSSSSPQGQSATSDTQDNGDLNANSAEIKKLLNNKDLHKVFPGIDYTPMYTQYPGCLTYPASQNNVTRDLAVLSQLTNTIRLYGTDCNQTELLLHSIDQLNLNGTVKVWLGVWQDSNGTTNARQLQQMYDIFDKYGTASFVGVIVGNEVLFRQDMTATALGEVISGVKANLTAKGITLPVAI